jgi:amidophosphoribosyltransferase
VVKALNPKLDGFEASCFDGHYITGDVPEASLASRGAPGDDDDDAQRSRLALHGGADGA